MVESNATNATNAYLSEDIYQDQVFVAKVLAEMLTDIDVINKNMIVIESDNCTAQYKSSEHFQSLIDLSTELDTQIIRVYGISGHGKGEVDHVGGLAKVAIRREIAAGEMLSTAADMVDCLRRKFGESQSPPYCFKEIHSNDLEPK